MFLLGLQTKKLNHPIIELKNVSLIEEKKKEIDNNEENDDNNEENDENINRTTEGNNTSTGNNFEK